MPNFFCFELLDQFADIEDRERVGNIIKNLAVRRISPLVEYFFLERLHSQILPSLSNCLFTEEVQTLYKLVKTHTSPSSSLHPKSFEFFRFPNSMVRLEPDYPPWLAYQKRFEMACRNAGISPGLAAAITGALGELVDNAFVHCDRPQSLIVGYRWGQKDEYTSRLSEFEYVVADAGIGVLASLKKHPSYFHLNDSADALHTAVRPGESRFGKGTGHGFGFRDVLSALHKLRCKIRLRSGPSSVLLDSSNSSELSKGIVGQQVQYDGFLIAVLFKVD